MKEVLNSPLFLPLIQQNLHKIGPEVELSVEQCPGYRSVDAIWVKCYNMRKKAQSAKTVASE